MQKIKIKSGGGAVLGSNSFLKKKLSLKRKLRRFSWDNKRSPVFSFVFKRLFFESPKVAGGGFLGNPQLKRLFTVFLFLGASIIVLLILGASVKAGSLNPSASPTASGYTLTDIYNRLTTNATATEANHLFAPTASPASSLYTLKQIYDAIPTIDASKVRLSTSYLGVTGTLTPDGGTASTADLFNGKTAQLTADWNLDIGTLNLACNTATFNGTANLVADTYDGAGNGTNRWCMTDSGDASATQILSGKIAWVGGQAVTGTMTDVEQQTITPSTSNQTITQGYHNGTGYCAGDSDLTAGNIMADVNIFGVTGTLLKNLYNGSAGSNVADYAFYTQAKGGVDDYNYAGTIPSDTYKGTWTDCTSGDHCGTNDSNADHKDNSTGLIWSKWLDSGTTHTWFWANNCYEPADQTPAGVCAANGDDGCQCQKKPTGSKVGCEALGTWRLPYQKELMQAYINGSYGNLSNPAYPYWSASTVSYSTHFAWDVALDGGRTYISTKPTSGSYRVRCVYAP